jgi:uncharacterized protein
MALLALWYFFTHRLLIAFNCAHPISQEFLIEAGHEDSGISRNGDWETPLLSATASEHVEIALILIRRYPDSVPCTNKQGMDPLMVAARKGLIPLLEPLIVCESPCSPNAQDQVGNTALHYASSGGHLKTIRALLAYGASPVAQNAHAWTPIAYSLTPEAESYFKNLVVEFEKRRVESLQQAREREREKERQRLAGVRLVTGDDMVPNDSQQIPPEWHGSPIEQKRIMTPTIGKTNYFDFGESVTRARASSGD